MTPSAQLGDRVTIASADGEHPRHSEASLVVLSGGELLLAWSAFSAIEGAAPGTAGEGAAAREWAHSRDNNPAEIWIAHSVNRGESWSEPRVAVGNDAGINVMQPALLLLAPDDLVMTFSRRDGPSAATRLLVRSRDGGHSWSAPRELVPSAGYLTAAHDRLVALRSGRLVQPAHTLAHDRMSTAVLISDDAGETWRQSAVLTVSEGTAGHLAGLWEASVAERADGGLLLFARTTVGTIFASESADDGDRWSAPASTGIRAPSSPSLLRTLPAGGLALLWNDSFDPSDVMLGVRRPLSFALSDSGRTWTAGVSIEDSPPFGYSYPSCTADGDDLLISYSITDPATRRWSLAFRRVRLSPRRDG